MMTGAHMAAGTEVLVAVACLRIAALHEGAFVPTLAQVAAVVDIPGGRSYLLHVHRECICMSCACGQQALSAVASLPCACQDPGRKVAVDLPCSLLPAVFVHVHVHVPGPQQTLLLQAMVRH